MKLGGVKVRHPDFYPGPGIAGCADAKAIAIPDISDRAIKLCAGAGQGAFARVGRCCAEGRPNIEDGEGNNPNHASIPSPEMPRPPRRLNLEGP